MDSLRSTVNTSCIFGLPRNSINPASEMMTKWLVKDMMTQNVNIFLGRHVNIPCVKHYIYKIFEEKSMHLTVVCCFGRGPSLLSTAH